MNPLTSNRRDLPCYDFCLSVSSQPIVTNQLGTVNNIIQVKKTDFEVFDALMVDSQKCSDVSGMNTVILYRMCAGGGLCNLEILFLLLLLSSSYHIGRTFTAP